MKNISEQIINPWMDRYLEPVKLTSGEFDDEKLIEMFEKEVVNKINQIYENSFTKTNKM